MNKTEKSIVDAVVNFVKNKSQPDVTIYDIRDGKIEIGLYTKDGMGGVYLIVKGNPLEEDYVTIHDALNGHRFGSISSKTWYYVLVPSLKELRR